MSPDPNQKPDEIINKNSKKQPPKRQFGILRIADIETERFELMDVDPRNPSQHQDYASCDRDISSIFLRTLFEDL